MLNEQVIALIDAVAAHNIETGALEAIKILSSVLTIILLLVQTPFIFQALRRETTTKRLWRHKPGRGCVMFLLIANLAMWVLTSFNIKQVGLSI